MGGFTVGVLLKFWLAPGQGVAGLVLATSLYTLFNAALELVWLSRRLGPLLDALFFRSLGRCLLSSAGGALLAREILRTDFPYAPVVALAAAAVFYCGLAGLTGDEFAIKYARSLFVRRAPTAPPTPSDQ
jgi:peptidoglycan biosynthesis protein MviN/MurJ (putative lipid II flippase)